jgi:hypothetical protein
MSEKQAHTFVYMFNQMQNSCYVLQGFLPEL